MSEPASRSKSRLWSLVNAIRVAGNIAVIVLVYWTIGVFVRRRYRRCQASGDTYWLDAPQAADAQGGERVR